jgi:hypothetical protein
MMMTNFADVDDGTTTMMMTNFADVDDVDDNNVDDDDNDVDDNEDDKNNDDDDDDNGITCCCCSNVSARGASDGCCGGPSVATHGLESGAGLGNHGLALLMAVIPTVHAVSACKNTFIYTFYKYYSLMIKKPKHY